MKPTAHLLTLLLISSTTSIVCASEVANHPIELSAGELSIVGQRITTVGPTSVIWDPLSAEGQNLFYDPNEGLILLQGPLTLQTNNLIINATELKLTTSPLTLSLKHPWLLTSWGAPVIAKAHQGECTPDGCRFNQTQITPQCKDSRACHWSIKSIDVAKDGRVTIRQGTLRAGRVPLFYLPWIQLNPPTQAGILPPRLAFRQDAGLIIGPGFYGPLGADSAIWASAAWRTHGGYETDLTLQGPRSLSSFHHINTGDEDHLLVEVDGAYDSTLGGAALSLQILNSIDGLDKFHILPDAKIKSSTVSRGLVSTPLGPIVLDSSATMLQPLTDSSASVWDTLHSEAAVGLFLPATHLIQGLFMDGTAKMRRIQLWSNVLRSDALDQPLPSHTQLILSPGFTYTKRLGPVVQRLSVRSTHRLWLEDNSQGDPLDQHTGTGSLYIALPLARGFQRSTLTHVLEPSITYRNNLFVAGQAPPWVLATQDLPRSGHGVEFAFETRLEHLWHNQLAKLKVGQRLDLPGHWQGESENTHWAYLFLDASFGPRMLKITTEAAFDERRHSISLARLGLKTTISRLGAHLGAEFIGDGLGPHLDQSSFDRMASSYNTPWPQEPNQHAGIWGQFNLRLPFDLDLFGSLRLKTWPDLEWHAVRYGLLYNSPCSLLSLGVQGIHFESFKAPDILATIVIR